MQLPLLLQGLIVFAAVSGMLLAASPAISGDYPNKPVELVVPSGAGGSTDLAARVLASIIPEFLGQPVVVVNKKGGGGQLGLDYLNKAKHDGYTMMEVTIGPITIYPALHKKAPYSYKNIRLVARTEIIPTVLVVRPDLGLKTIDEIAVAAKKEPGKLSFAIASMGSVSELGMRSVMSAAGIGPEDMIGIPFDGSADALAAVLGKHADMVFINLTPAFDHISAGKLIAVGISTEKRHKALPEIPTFAETGYANAAISGWKGVAAPKNVPDDVVNVWKDAIEKTVKSKVWQKFQKKLGSTPAYLGPEDATKYAEKQFNTFRKIAVDNNLLMD
jgi:tripartite-type tricarboxylate transporter receptor subunit TctC